MNQVQDEWRKMKIAYQQRYVRYLRTYMQTDNKESKGHMLECSHVLIHVFGLSDQQISELEHNYCGLTNDDLKD